MEFLFYFFIYSFIGWLCECVYCGIGQRRFINRGFLFGPYCPIYGFGALIIIYFLLKHKDSPPLVFISGLFLTSILEYFTSWIMELLFNEKWWDYSKYYFNINGRVCLINSILFGIMGLVLVYFVHPKITNIYNSIPRKISEYIILIILVLFGIDLFVTIKHLIKRKEINKMLIITLNNAKHQFDNHINNQQINQKISFDSWIKNDVEFKEKLNKFKKLDKSHISKTFPNHKNIKNLIKKISDSN